MASLSPPALQLDLTNAEYVDQLKDEQLDTILSSNALEHIHFDQPVPDRFHRLLATGFLLSAGVK